MSKQMVRLLLVDDESSVRDPLAKHLRAVHHYEVDVAADAEGAWQRLAQAEGQYEVALIDDVLSPAPGQEPEPCGVKLIQEIKAHYPSIEVIIFTGWGMKSGLEALRAGAYRYLAKPFNLEELGVLIQTAAEHSRLLNTMREKQLLEKLMETSAALLSERGLPEVLDTILHGVRAIGFDRIRLYLLSEERQAMIGHAQVGMEMEFVGFEFPVTDNIHTQILMQNSHPQVFERKEGELWPYEDQLNKGGVEQWLGVPLWLHGKFIGMLSADNKFSQRPILREELRPVALFAAQAAAAIENARLRDKEKEATQQAERRARNLKAVQEISANISSLMELDKILESACRAAVELFGVDHSGLVLFDETDYKRGWVKAEYPDLGTRDIEIPVFGVLIEEQLVISKEPLVLADVSNGRLLGPVGEIFGQFDIRSILIVPIVIKEQLIGSFSLDAISRLRAFTEEEVELCKIVAAEVAVAIENSRSLREIRRHNEQLESLNQITAQMNAALDLDSILRIALKEGLQAVKASAGTIMLLNSLTNKLEIRARSFQDEVRTELSEWKWRIDEGIAGYAIQTGRACNCHDITRDAHFVGSVSERNFQSLLAVPITSYDRVLGAINVKGKDIHFFQEDDIQVLSTLCNHVAIALESQRLRDISHILFTLPLDEMLSKIVEWACVLIGTGFGDIFLFEEESGEIVRAASFPLGRKAEDKPRNQGGLTAEIRSEGKPIVINDAQKDPRVRLSTKKRGIKSLMGVPLKVRGENNDLWDVKTVGVLYVDMMQQRELNNRDVELLQSLANQAAIAIEKTHLYEVATREHDRSKRLASQLLALTEIMQQIQAELDLPNLLNLISRLAAQLLGANAGGILLLDESKQYLTFKGAFKLSQRAIEGTCDLVGSSIAGRVVETGKPIIANDIPNNPHFYNPAADEEGWLAIMSTPLCVGKKIIGTLDVHSRSKLYAFDEDDLQILSLMANQAAIAIENVRLFQQTSQRALALEALHLTSLDITRRHPMPELVTTILDRAVRLLNARGGCLYQLNETRQNIKVMALSNRPDLKVGMTRKLQNDVVGQVIKNRTSLSVPNYKNWPAKRWQNDPHPFSVVAGAPVAWEDKIWGAIAIHDEVEGRNFGEEELNLLSHLGNLAAVALANTDLVTKDEAKLRRLEKLAQANSEVISDLATMPLDERLNLITRHASEILEAEACAIFLVKRSGILNLEASYGHKEGFFEKGREFVIQSGKQTGLTGHIAYEGKLFNAYGEALNNHFAAGRGPYHGVSEDLYSTLAIPLKQVGKSEKNLIGLLRADNKKGRDGQSGPAISFTQEDEWILSLFADAIVVAIQGAELVTELRQQKDDLVHLNEITDRHRHLLLALDEASRRIRAEKETSKLLQDIVRLAAELAGCTTGGLYVNRPQLKELELQVTYVLPPALTGNRLSHADGLVGLVARTGQSKIIFDYADWPDREHILDDYHFKTAIGIPLKQAGEIEAVLFVANETDLSWFAPADLEILESFAVQASLALQTSRLLNREQRMFRPLAILHKVSDYIQIARDVEKISHVVLTTITAGYGLGFNRAALFLLDKRREYLIGRMGIGYLDELSAREDWGNHHQRGLEDFEQYRTVLEQEGLPLTPIGERVRRLRIPVRSADSDVFSQSVLGKGHILVTQGELDRLPGSFIETFEPDLPFIIVPLLARNQVIGLLVADNKFTHYPITPEDMESLLTFASTAAVAIDNIRLFRETEAAQARLRSFYEASNALVSSREPEQVLQDTVEQARLTGQASGVSIFLIDPVGGQARYLITGGRDQKVDLEGLIRPDGLSMRVMLSGQPEVIEDADKERNRVNPTMFRHNIAAALCLPVSVEGRRIGVMWLHYERPRYFAKAEIEALQLYVNQAALAYDSARRIKELDYLRRTAETFAGAARPQEVLELTVQSALEIMQADSTFIWSYDAVRDQFILDRSVGVGIPNKSWEKFQKISPRQGGIAFTVMEQGWVGVTDINDIQRYEFLGGTTPKLLREMGTRSFQGIALTVDKEKLGVLFVNYNRHRSFSQEEQKTAQIFANHAALVLRHAKLRDQVSKARNAARVVAEVTVLENLQSTLESILKGTRDVLDCDVVTLYTYDQDRHEVGFPPAMVGVNHPEKVLELGRVAKQSLVYDILTRDDLLEVGNRMSYPLKDTPFAKREAIISSKGIPLTTGERKVGVMFVNYRTHHHFTEGELTNIELFANQAAVAIRNAQLYERVQKRTRALETLYEAGRAVTSSLDPEEILWVIAEQSWRLIDTSYFGNLAIVTGNHLKSVAAYPPEHFSGIQKVIGNVDLNSAEPIGVMGRAVKTGQARLIGDITEDSDYIKYYPGTLSELAVPIKRGTKIMGVINVEASEHNAFDDEDQRTLESLAAQAAIAIENSRLFEQIQRRTHLLDAAAQVARDATAILDIDQLLHETVRLISERFDCYHAAVFLIDDDRYAILRATYPGEDQRMLKPTHKLRVGHEGIVGVVAHSGKPHLAPDVSKDPYYIANLPSTQAEVAFPLIVHEQVIGVLDVQSTKTGDWQAEDIATLQTMADQLANAIHNAQLYQRIAERLKETNILQHVAVSLAGALELNDVLSLIMFGAMKLTSTPAISVLLWDDQLEKFTQALRVDESGVLYPYEVKARSKGGLARQIMDERKSIAIFDARQIPDFNRAFLEQGYLSSLGTPLVSQNEAIGVLYVHDREPRQFTNHQIVLLETLAGQAAVAIDRARQYEKLKNTYEELKRTKGLVGARTALAWMGMATSTWRHAIDKHAITIREQVQLLARNLTQAELTQKYPQLNDRLVTIERLVNKILEKPLTPPLSAEEGVEPVTINDLVSERAKQLWQNEPYKLATLQLDLQLSGTATVRVSPEWLRRAFDILADNAIDAVAGRELRAIIIGTRIMKQGVDIFISDSGPGLPQEIKEKMGLEVIEKPEDAKGLGMGLLMAQTIVQTYSGALRVDSTSPTGTSMVIWLPLENKEG